MKKIALSSNRAATYINKELKTNYTKGSVINIRTIIKLLLSDTTGRESKKVFLSEIIDVSNEDDLRAIFNVSKRRAKELKKLVDEVNDELLSGVWERQEREFEENYQKIIRRKDIIDNIGDSNNNNSNDKNN
jgi:hypothetical protein